MTYHDNLANFNSFDMFKYYLKSNQKYYKYQDTKYSIDEDDMKWDVYSNMSCYNFLKDLTDVVVGSIDVELFKLFSKTVKKFEGNIIYQSYKGNYTDSNYNIFNQMIINCPNLDTIIINNMNSLLVDNTYCLNLTTLYNSNISTLIINNSKEFNIVFDDMLEPRTKALKIIINNYENKKYETKNIFFSNKL